VNAEHVQCIYLMCIHVILYAMHVEIKDFIRAWLLSSDVSIRRSEYRRYDCTNNLHALQ